MMQVYLTDVILAINNIVGLFVVVRFLNQLLEKRKIKAVKRKWGLISLLVVAIIINIVFDNIGTNLVLGLALNYFIGHLFYLGKKHIKLITAIFIVVFSFITELMTAILFGLLFDISIQGIRDNLMYLFLGGIVSKILLIMVIEMIIRFRRRKASKVSLSSWLLIISIPVISIVLAVTSVYELVLNNSFDNISVFICLAIIYINIITFYLFDNIIIQIEENNRIRFHEEQLLLQQIQYQNIILGHSQVEKTRHDMLGHFIAIGGYLEKHKIEDAIDYIGKLHKELDFLRQGIFSKNVAVDAIINNRKVKAKKLGFDFIHDIIIPESFNMDDMDICIVLGNALNNAIEACQRIDDATNKIIELKMRYKRDSLLLEVKNPYDIDTIELKGENFVSSKSFRRKGEMGTGIANIKAVVEKYNGFCKINSQSERFLLKVIIPDKKKS